jgi:uncharacterized protein (TIGR03382 family)
VRSSFASFIVTAGAVALWQVPAAAGVIISHIGANNPVLEGFVANGGTSGSVASGAVPAWHLEGNWENTQMIYQFSADDQSALSGDWTLTANFRNLSESSSFESGPWISFIMNGNRFDVSLRQNNLSTDPADQLVQANVIDAFYDGGPLLTYPLGGLGANYAQVQILYHASSHSADYYVNGALAIQGVTAEHRAPAYSGLVFGADSGDFNLVRLDSAVPEPASGLLAFGALVLAAVWRRRLRR